MGIAPRNQLLDSWHANGGRPETDLTNVSFTAGLQGSGGIEVDAFDAAGNDYLSAHLTAAVTYHISANKSGFISSIDGILLNGQSGLPSRPMAVAVTVAKDNNTENLLVDGIPIGNIALQGGVAVAATETVPPSGTVSFSGTFSVPTDLASTDASPDLLGAVNTGVGDAIAETTTFTFSSVSNSASAEVQFTSGSVTQITASPSISAPASGTEQTITLTAEDTNGNPVANAPIVLTPDGRRQAFGSRPSMAKHFSNQKVKHTCRSQRRYRCN